MAGRSEDPNKLVTVACKIPTSVRDRFAGIALIKGDIKVARRLERLILADIRENAPHVPPTIDENTLIGSSHFAARQRDDKITLDPVQVQS